MRPTGTLVCLLAAVCLVLTAGHAAAQPAGRVDVRPIIAALDDGERVVRAPGTVAHLDEARVRDELGAGVRLVVLPYADYELYQEENGHNQYYDLVNGPIQDWSQKRHVPVVLVTGLDVTIFGAQASTLDHRLAADFDELRTTTANRDVTERVIVFARFGRGLPPGAAEDVEIAHPAPVPAPPARVAEVVAALERDPILNAPGRTEPIADWVVEFARQQYGLRVRVAAFPYLEPGRPVTDYATPLGAAFPDDVVLVLQGDWLDIAAPDQRKAAAARAFAYSDADLVLLSGGNGSTHLLRKTLERLDLLLVDTAWGHPQPPPQPRAPAFDVQRTVSALAPWVLTGAALVLGGAGVLRHRTRTRAAAAGEERAVRVETASAMATIGDLGARVLSAEEAGEPVHPAAGERHATALLLYDQAHTSAAMAEVRLVAEEGLALLTDTERPATTQSGRKRRKADRRKARKQEASRPQVTWRKTR